MANEAQNNLVDILYKLACGELNNLCVKRNDMPVEYFEKLKVVMKLMELGRVTDVALRESK